VGIDTTTMNGRMMVGMLAVLAEWEREAIGQRTREALAIKKRQGVRLGRPPVPLPGTVRRRVKLMRARGDRSFASIADQLNAERVPTATGRGRWHAEMVRRLLAA
jgi:DNA invertase Pin-like site-specific DNA recombinase